MAAEANLIKSADLARVREADFTSRFEKNVKKLIEALGITRKIEKAAGTALKVHKVVGTLQPGAVAEGDIIPLSHYETQEKPVGEITLNKHRKATSAEAIIEKGYDQAVNETTDKMLKDMQKEIRTEFFEFLRTVDGSGTATGVGLQAALANAWGQLQALFEDDDAQPVFFLNQMDVADYLGKASVTTQTAFGFTYIENFLGLGTVILNSSVPAGKFYATVAENLVLYYINMGNADLGEVFSFTTDETGYIGIHETPDYDNLTASDTAVDGIKIFPDVVEGILVGTIAAETTNAEG